MKSQLIIFAILFLNGSLAWASEQDFNKVCSYFEKLKIESSKRSLSRDDRENFINELVKKNIAENSPARQTWVLVLGGVPDVRYDMYKITAEDILKKSWQCSAMKKLLPTLGEK